MYKITLFCFIALSVNQIGYCQDVNISFFDGTLGSLKSEIKKNEKEVKKTIGENKAWVKSQKKEYKKIEKENRRRKKSRAKLKKNRQDSTDSLSNNSAVYDSLTYLAMETDALPEAYQDSLKNYKKLQEEYFVYTDTLYSYKEIMNWDAAKKTSKKEALNYSKERLEGNQYYDQLATYNQEVLGFHKEYKIYKDSLKSTDLQDYEVKYMLQMKKEELSKKYGAMATEQAEQKLLELTESPLPASSPEMEQLKAMNDMAKAAMDDGGIVNQSKDKGINHFLGKEEALQDVIEKTSELKETYSKVVDAKDLTTATKRNSLKDEPLGKRVVFGGSFQIRVDQTTSLDMNPSVAFKINKKWSIGVGGNYRANAELVDFTNTYQKTAIYGYRVFTQYLLFMSFYGHAEFEALTNNNEVVLTGTDEQQLWNYSALAGLERKFHLRGKLGANVAILYNFNHKTNDLNSSPWNVRFGFDFGVK